MPGGEDRLLTDLARLAELDQHDVIGPERSDRRRVSRQRCGDILLVQLLDRGLILRAGSGPASVLNGSLRPACGRCNRRAHEKHTEASPSLPLAGR